ncbi:MAG: response regulator transcription factor [Burkholderiales bacterium]|nr:response regulator transcription factor [Burkholderiales bacterium]
MKLLIIDDHPVVREGLAAVLRQLDGGAEVLEAADGEQGLHQLAQHADVDGVLVDLRMAGLAGLPTLARLRALRPQLPVMVISASEDPADVRRAMAAGARGYIPKSAGRSTLLAAVHLVLAGEQYVPPLLLQEAAAAPATLGGLTPRQLEVLGLLCQGHANREIGLALQMHEKTVKAHVGAVFKVLGVVNRTQAVEAARAAGFNG